MVLSIKAGRRTARSNTKKEVDMLETIVIILVVLWALGFFAFHVGGGLIHALIVIALVILIIRLLKGQKVL
jgi:fatty acid desaturase